MSEKQLKAFLEMVKADAKLQENLKAAADLDAVAAIATEVGFSISADDLKKAQAEISEDELENAAGGINTWLVMGYWTNTGMAGLGVLGRDLATVKKPTGPC